MEMQVLVDSRLSLVSSKAHGRLPELGAALRSSQ